MQAEEYSRDQTIVAYLPDSLQPIVQVLENKRRLKPAHIVRLLNEHYIPEKDLQPWTDFSHSSDHSYGRKLVYRGSHFEIMVMSWLPGDYSGIHDHGYTQYGAVKLYGDAEHATFYLEGERIHTLTRTMLESGTIIGVSHELIHQMGNPENGKPFISLHIYACANDRDSITEDARLFDPVRCNIQRLDGGVFFDLSPLEVNGTEQGPKGDFPTSLRYQTELLRRVLKKENPHTSKEEILEEIISPSVFSQLREDLMTYTDHRGFSTSSSYWNILNWELKESACLLDTLSDNFGTEDAFQSYANVYDAVVGIPCLQQFMAPYLEYILSHYQIDLYEKELLSVGCGTGLVESYMMQQFRLKREKLLGIDVSASMVEVASGRIPAKLGDVLNLDPAVKTWDIVYSGLNVLQYVGNKAMRQAVEKTAAVLKPGGFFIGDFITPDHIRTYPNVLYGASGQVISLRKPRLIEEDGAIFQESEIINVDMLEGYVRIHNAGKHRRFLPPVHRVRSYFMEVFTGPVELYDARTLNVIPEDADTCPSTRYIVVAKQSK